MGHTAPWPAHSRHAQQARLLLSPLSGTSFLHSFFSSSSSSTQLKAKEAQAPPGGVCWLHFKGAALLNGLTFSCLLVCSTMVPRALVHQGQCGATDLAGKPPRHQRGRMHYRGREGTGPVPWHSALGPWAPADACGHGHAKDTSAYHFVPTTTTYPASHTAFPRMRRMRGGCHLVRPIAIHIYGIRIHAHMHMHMGYGYGYGYGYARQARGGRGRSDNAARG